MRSPFVSRALILLYHRIAKPDHDPWNLCVRPERFEQHLEHINAEYRPVSLGELQDGLQRRAVPDGAVVVTFDDGYGDNLTTAKPLLERFGMPATIFIATGAIGAPRDFWWDQLTTLILSPVELPEVLELRLGRRTVQWRVLQAGAPSARRRRRSLIGLTAPDGAHLDRSELYHAIYTELRQLDPRSQAETLDHLAQWSRAPEHWWLRYPTLTQDGVRELARGCLIEIGAHTVTHPVLSRLPLIDQRSEILRSRAQLTEWIGLPITSFAYPHGTRADFTPVSTSIVAAAGFRCACSSETATVQRSSDIYALPRVCVGDWDADHFTRVLRSWWRS